MFVVLIIGGVNWGLVGFFEYNLVDEVFGSLSTASRVVYSLVGLATIYILFKVLAARKGVTDSDTNTA